MGTVFAIGHPYLHLVLGCALLKRSGLPVLFQAVSIDGRRELDHSQYFDKNRERERRTAETNPEKNAIFLHWLLVGIRIRSRHLKRTILEERFCVRHHSDSIGCPVVWSQKCCWVFWWRVESKRGGVQENVGALRLDQMLVRRQTRKRLPSAVIKFICSYVSCLWYFLW